MANQFQSLNLNLNVSKKDTVRYLAVLCTALWLTTVAFPVDIRHLTGIGLGLSIVYWLYLQKASDVSDFNKTTHIRLNAVIAASRITPRKGDLTSDAQLKRAGIDISAGRVDNSISYIPKHLYKDPDLINLLYSVLDFREYNHSAFLDTVWTLDNLIALHSEMSIGSGLSNCTMHSQEAKKYADLALNHFNTFQLSLPILPIVETKFKNKAKRLHLLVLRHLDDIYNICNKQSIGTKNSPAARSGYDNINIPRPSSDPYEFNAGFDVF